MVEKVVDPTEKQIGNVGFMLGLILYVWQGFTIVISYFNPQSFFEKAFMIFIHLFGWLFVSLIVTYILMTIFYAFFWRNKC